MQGESLASVFGDCFHEFGFVTTLGHSDVYGAATYLGQPGSELLGIFGQNRYEHGARNVIAIQCPGVIVFLGGQVERNVAVDASK